MTTAASPWRRGREEEGTERRGREEEKRKVAKVCKLELLSLSGWPELVGLSRTGLGVVGRSYRRVRRLGGDIRRGEYGVRHLLLGIYNTAFNLSCDSSTFQSSYLFTAGDGPPARHYDCVYSVHVVPLVRALQSHYSVH